MTARIRQRAAAVALCLAYALVSTVLLAPGADAADPNRILITGDSITQGSAGDYTWRYRLWRQLSRTAAGEVRFVGTRSDVFDNVHNTYGSQDYRVDFDAKLHAAQWGGAFTQELDQVAGQVAATSPDTMIVMLGSNDLSALTGPTETIENLRTYIRRARGAEPGLDVVVGQVVNRYDAWSRSYDMTREVNAYAEQLDDLAAELSTADERVVIAQTLNGWDARTLTKDGTHPNPAGEAHIARRVAQALAELGIGATSSSIADLESWRPLLRNHEDSSVKELPESFAPPEDQNAGLLERMYALEISPWHEVRYGVDKGAEAWTWRITNSGDYH